MSSSTKDLLDRGSDEKGWSDAAKLAAICQFIDQLSSGESDLETFLDGFTPGADGATAESTVTYGEGDERIVLEIIDKGGCGCTTPMLPKQPAKRDAFGVAIDALTTLLMKMAGAGVAMDSPAMHKAVEEAVAQLANDWGD